MLSLNCDPIALAILGLGGVLVGLVELGLACVRRFPTWGISLGLVLLLGLVGGVAYATGEGPIFGQPALVLAAFLLTLLLFRSKQSIAGRPVVQGAILTLLGGALVGYAGYRLDRGLENDLCETDFLLSYVTDPVDESNPARLARTDAGTIIPLFETSPGAVWPTQAEEDHFLRDLRLQTRLIQTGPPELKYNCHGWVFTGGRYWVRSPRVATILEDNGYLAVQQPRSGDVAVFRNPLGEIVHTGLVRSGSDHGPILIESKWGRFGRFVHGPNEHAYRGNEITYYRSSRGTHLLQGVEDTATEAPAPAVNSPSGEGN